MRSLLLAALTAGAAALAAPANATWYEAKSQHFIIYADDNPEVVKAFAARLEIFDKAVRTVRRMGDQPLSDSTRLRVYALRDIEAVARLAGRSDVAGFYNARASGAVSFVPLRSQGSDKMDLDAESIFFHEYGHHLQLQFASAALPEWVVEGFAEFFATADIKKDGSVVIGSPPLYRARGIVKGTGPSIEQMLSGDYRTIDSEGVDFLYGQAWLLTHYLQFEPSRKGQLKTYLDAIQMGLTPIDAANAAFGDLKALSREVTRYKKATLLGVEISPRALAIAPIQLRQLRAGEAAMMPIHIRSTRGVDDKTAPRVLADARKVAADYPNDPFVQGALAEAEADAHNYAAASAAADKAIAADPANVHALIYKGRAEMALAREKKDAADWEQVRSWFAKANKVDPQNAEALMLFFQSFGEAGEAPTKNAIDGLLYAVTLAPQDEPLRINAVRLLLAQNRVADARKMFAPIAFTPHMSNAARETNAKIVAAMEAEDGKTALSLMDKALEQAQSRDKEP